jgi:hypothetical protein
MPLQKGTTRISSHPLAKNLPPCCAVRGWLVYWHFGCVLDRLLIVDGACSGTEAAALPKHTGKVVLGIVKRSDTSKGFVVVAKLRICESCRCLTAPRGV